MMERDHVKIQMEGERERKESKWEGVECNSIYVALRCEIEIAGTCSKLLLAASIKPGIADDGSIGPGRFAPWQYYTWYTHDVRVPTVSNHKEVTIVILLFAHVDSARLFVIKHLSHIFVYIYIYITKRGIGREWYEEHGE